MMNGEIIEGQKRGVWKGNYDSSGKYMFVDRQNNESQLALRTVHLVEKRQEWRKLYLLY